MSTNVSGQRELNGAGPAEAIYLLQTTYDDGHAAGTAKLSPHAADQGLGSVFATRLIKTTYEYAFDARSRPLVRGQRPAANIKGVFVSRFY